MRISSHKCIKKCLLRKGTITIFIALGKTSIIKFYFATYKNYSSAQIYKFRKQTTTLLRRF